MAYRNIGKDRSNLVRQIVESRGLTLFQISRESRVRYRDSRYFIPHQLHAHLRNVGFTPKIHQILALSSITNYRPADWFSVLGFQLDAIARLQATLPAKRTQLIDSTLHDDQEWIPWFTDVFPRASAQGVVSFGQLLSSGTFRKASTFPFRESSPFLYAQVGYEDAFASPDLLPGSIIRVDTRKKHDSSELKSIPKPFVLIEHANGYSICRLLYERAGHITLRSGELPFPQIELRLDREARVLGVADLHLRLLVGSHHPTVSDEPPPLSVGLLPQDSAPLTLGRLLTRSRKRSGLSFREASRLSQKVAAQLKDDNYFCAPGALSDYEVRGDPPRHVHKLTTLAVLYALKFSDLINAAALDVGEIGRDPMPESLLSRGHSVSRLDSATPVQQAGFVHDLVENFEEIPLFLAKALPTLVGLPTISLRDIYWMGSQTASQHLRLKNTILTIIDRRRKKPFDAPRSTPTEQPLFMLLTRDQGYVAAACRQEGELLVAHPFSDGFQGPLHLRNGIDAEVLGRIVATLRWLA